MSESLYDFIDIDEPFVEPLANVPHPTKEKSVGIVGNVQPRNNKRGYVSHRRRHGPEKGFFEKGNGYSISDEVLRKLMRFDVKFVYIAETDTGKVHEFNINSFINGQRFDEGDPQHCAEINSAIKTWEDHESELIV